MKKTGGLLLLLLFVLSAALLPIRESQALNVQLLRPQQGFTKGYQLYTSENLSQWDFGMGLNLNYVQHPLEVGITATATRSTGIVDRFLTGDFLFSLGFTDNFSVNLDVPLNFYHDIAPIFIPNRNQGAGDMGDIMLSGKITVVDAGKNPHHLGFALVPFVTAPTGKNSVYFGDTNVTGGLTLVGDIEYKDNRIYFNVGPKFRQKENIQNLVVGHELLYGLGYQRPLSKKYHWNIIVEAYGSTTFDNFLTEEISSPVQGHMLFQKKWLEDQKLVLNFGGGMGFDNGYGAPDFRTMASLGYLFKHKEKSRPVLDAPIVLEGVYFDNDKSIIKPVSYPVLDHAVTVLNKYPDKMIFVVGHTDSNASDAYNMRLSAARAKSVRQYFISKGIPVDHILSEGRGERFPRDDNATAAGRARNRRVELELKEF